jgi:hypothetical protein
MTPINIDPAKLRPSLRVQLTVLYAGLFTVLAVAVLAVSGALERQGSTSIDGGSSSSNAIFGQHFDVGPLIVAVVAGMAAVGPAWWIAGRFLRPAAPSAKAAGK